MAQNYTVKEVEGQPRTFTLKNGPAAGKQMVSYTLTVTGNDGAEQSVELSQIPTTAAPKVGDSIFGNIVPSSDPIKYPAKLKKEKPQNFSGGGGGRSGSPDRNKDSIERQVAFKGAVELVVAMSPKDMPQGAVKDALAGFFEAGLALIQGEAPVQTTSKVSPSSLPPSDPADPGPSDPPPDVEGEVVPDQAGRIPINTDHLRAAYKGYQNQHGKEKAHRDWQLKLTSMGLTTETLDQATHDQRVDLLNFLDDTPF